MQIKIKNSATKATIDIEGIIGESGENGTNYEKIKSKIDQINAMQVAEIEVNISSVGGAVQDALLIYEALKNNPARITTTCYGYTASAATIIAQAADRGFRQISKTALYLIHRCSTCVEGSAEELNNQADMLAKTDANIVKIYATNSEKSEVEFAKLMNENGGKGVWLTAEQTLEYGLADKIIEPKKGVLNCISQFLSQLVGATPLPDPKLQLNRQVVENKEFAPTQRGKYSEDGKREREIIALQELYKPTCIERLEDPDYINAEPPLSPRERAYQADAKLFY